MARNQLMRILSRSDKGASRAYGVGGVLSRLWSQMLKDLDVNIARWNDYMHSFVTDPRNGIPPIRNAQTSARGNLTKEFSRPHMTWKVFMKALRFLKVVKVDFAIKCYFASGRTSTHGTTVDFGMPVQPATTFMEDISHQQPDPAPVYQNGLVDPDPVFTEAEDDEFVHDFISMLANPFMFPFASEDETSEYIAPTPENPEGSHIYRAWATDDDFGGSILAKGMFAQYQADKRAMELDHAHHEQ